ncbi:MAG: myxococcus cysteine-rich repeat containing protein [Gammaproteobacteria bacterium]
MDTQFFSYRAIAVLLLALSCAAAHAQCGNGLPDRGEACDDGNTATGDGCSDACRIETGFTCSAALSAAVENAIGNGDFEAPPEADPEWIIESALYGTALCSVSSCGDNELVRPADGKGWLWLGGALAPETASATQSVRLQQTDMSLEFDVAQSTCDGPADTLSLSIDGNPVWTASGADPDCGNTVYRRVLVPLTTANGGPYNNDQIHTLRFLAQTQSLNGGETNFLIDNVGVIRSSGSPSPSACAPVSGLCNVQSFDSANSGDLNAIGWTTFAGANSSTGAEWGTTDDDRCHSANGTPGNFTGRTGIAACVDSDAADPGLTEAFLCAGPFDFRSRIGSAASFTGQFHPFGAADTNDQLVLLVGTVPPDSTTIENYELAWSADDTGLGQLFAVPGAQIDVDLASMDDTSDVHMCFGYRGDFDWSAQIDDFTLTATNCGAGDRDGDGVLDANDNCTVVSNPMQIDSNGDGIGNRCDADIAGPLGLGLDDCMVNVLDLAAFRSAFGSTPASANWNADADFSGADGPPDGRINTIDLGHLRLAFFQSPGPSAAGCTQ